MANKFRQKNIFESSFDSVEFDDGFLKKIDSELKMNKINEKQIDLSNKYKMNDKQGNDEKNISDIKANYYDLPLFIEDLDDSDFFDFDKNHKKKYSSKVLNNNKDEKVKKGACSIDFNTCLSPVLGPKTSKEVNLSSSTPLKPNDDSLLNEKPSISQKLEKNPPTNSEFDYLEADLFDDWGIDETVKKNPPQDTVTLSQALKLIEEAESARQSDHEHLNQSLDLLTGEVVGADIGNLFEESFDLPKSSEKKDNEKSFDNSIIVLDEFKARCKPTAAQKLNFDSEKSNLFNLNLDEEFGKGFNSDDDFDNLTQKLLKKPKIALNYNKSNSKSNFAKTKKITPLKDCNLNDSIDDFIVLKKNRGKCFKIIESDESEDSPSPKFCRQNFTKRKNFQKFGREFIDSEAEVSDEVEVSSDEAVEDGEYDKSFLDEDSYFSQNCSANMTAKYLESVKTVKQYGSFKIPAAKPYIPAKIFSQIPEEGSTDYEIDSFCVPNDVEEEIKTDLSDLEVAEKILEMDRKKRKRKRIQRLKKFK